MSTVFEAFLRNFYAHEQSQFRVGSEILNWSGSGSLADWAYLPDMKTDITLRGAERTLILDAKFYSEPLPKNQYGGRRVRSGHLYQLLAYLRHASARPGPPVSGGLIYAAAGDAFRLRYELDGFDLQVVAIDLDQPWDLIRDDLLSFIRPSALFLSP